MLSGSTSGTRMFLRTLVYEFLHVSYRNSMGALKGSLRRISYN